jgi:3-dehydroquinate synthase
MIEFPIQLTYNHRVIFTEGVFSPENESLTNVLTLSENRGRQRPRALVFIDEGLIQGDPALLGHVAAWFARRSATVDLRSAPIVIPGGEPCKNDLALVEMLWGEINAAALDRHSYVVVIGGGATLDLVGLAAATAHRGIRLIRLPTTTLSQGDGGVGVKNGINFFGKKNWIGTFAVPYAVINDVKFLDGLPPDDKRAGYIEAIKVGLIRDGSFFEEMERNLEAMQNFEPKIMRRVIERSAELHVKHIATGGDPFELGSARPLDFGHWVAHKLEQITQFSVSHGQAVAIGIAVDLIYANLAGMLDEDVCVRILKLIDELGFTLWHDALLSPLEANPSQLAIIQGLEEFREHLGGDLCITLVIGIGKAVEVREMDPKLVRQAIMQLQAITRPD